MSNLGLPLQPNDNVSIKIGEKCYDFSKDMVTKYPKLLSPETRYMIGFDSLLILKKTL